MDPETRKALADSCKYADRILDTMFVRMVVRDGERIPLLRCPGCGEWGEVDDDQLRGKVSVHHEECGFHETREFLANHSIRVVDEVADGP